MSDWIIKSYVRHKDKCFFVSTINRESSSILGGTYAETIVWDYDWDTNTRGDLLGIGEGAKDSIYTHQAICKRIFETGLVEEPEKL